MVNQSEPAEKATQLRPFGYMDAVLAAALLEKRQAELPQRGRGRRKASDPGDSGTRIRADAIALMAQCAAHGIVVPVSLVDFLAGLLGVPWSDPVRPALPAGQWKAIREECKAPGLAGRLDVESITADDLTRKAANVARAAGVHRQTIYRCRQSAQYIEGVRWQVRQGSIASAVASLTHQLEKQSASDRNQEEIERGERIAAARRSAQHRAYDLWNMVRDNWPGHPVKSPLDGRVYQTEAEYLAHLEKADPSVVPVRHNKNQ